MSIQLSEYDYYLADDGMVFGFRVYETGEKKILELIESKFESDKNQKNIFYFADVNEIQEIYQLQRRKNVSYQMRNENSFIRERHPPKALIDVLDKNTITINDLKEYFPSNKISQTLSKSLWKDKVKNLDGISYVMFYILNGPTKQFAPPTEKQLQEAQKFFSKLSKKPQNYLEIIENASQSLREITKSSYSNIRGYTLHGIDINPSFIENYLSLSDAIEKAESTVSKLKSLFPQNIHIIDLEDSMRQMRDIIEYNLQAIIEHNLNVNNKTPTQETSYSPPSIKSPVISDGIQSMSRPENFSKISEPSPQDNPDKGFLAIIFNKIKGLFGRNPREK